MSKSDFPIFKNKRKLVYLDSAATSQKPRVVIKAITDFYENHNANVHRGVCKLSADATELYEKAREKVAGFIGAKDIVFTKNATESINITAKGLVDVTSKNNVVVSVMEHHSNFVPWQQICNANGAEFRIADIEPDGSIDVETIGRMIDSKTKIVAITHMSNVLGSIVDIKAVTDIAHDKGALVLVDGAQSVPHFKVDVEKIGCDFLVFSAHKMLGPMGIGALYCKDYEQIEPVAFGGGMIKLVENESTSWNEAPWRFEAGTPNVAGAVGFKAAAEYLTKFGMENIERHEKELLNYATERLEKINGLVIYGTTPKKSGIVSFNLEGVHAHDTASIADNYGVCIRAGHHCCQPLMRRLGIVASVRASFYLYNDKKDIDKLAEALENAKKVMKR